MGFDSDKNVAAASRLTFLQLKEVRDSGGFATNAAINKLIRPLARIRNVENNDGSRTAIYENSFVDYVRDRLAEEGDSANGNQYHA